MPKSYSIAPLTVLLVMTVCPQRSAGQEAPRVWVSTESALLSKPSDLVVAPDGAVFVLDATESRVLVMHAPGEVAMQVGREGSGPSEFREPSELSLLGDGFEVLDRGNDRTQRFGADGTYVSTRRLPPYGSLYAVAISNGQVAVNTLGDSLLVAVYDTTGTLRARFGNPPAPMPRGISMAAVRKEVLGGHVPGFFRNTVEPHFAPDGTVWLAWLTDARVDRWTADGSRLCSYELEEPELDGIRRAFFARYDDPNLRGLPSLSFIADIYAATSGAWVLLKGGEEDPAVVVHVSSDGRRVGRWSFPEARGATLLAVDEAKGTVFLALGPTAELVEFALDRAGGGS